MPRKNPVPELEVAICKRLAMRRKSAMLSRVALASLIQVDSGMLSSCEHCRVPLRYWLAYRIASVIPLNAVWLATGQAHSDVDLPLPSPADLGVTESALFSTVYEEKLKGLLALKSASIQSRENGYRIGFPASVRGRLAMADILRQYAENYVKYLGDEQIHDFVDEVRVYMANRFEHYKSQNTEPSIVQKKRLDEFERVLPAVKARRRNKV